MKPSMETFAKKINEVYNSNRFWKVLFVWYMVLFALDLILAAVSDRDRKTSLLNAVSVGLGFGITGYHINRTGGWKAENQ